MKKFELKETRIPNLFYTEMLQKSSMDIPENVVDQCYDSLFMTMAQYCDLRKSKEEKIALIIRDLKNNFKIAFVVEYVPGDNEEVEDKGNWAITLTFDEEDVKDAKKFYSTDSAFTYLLSKVTRELHGFRFSQGEVVPRIIELLIELLIKWLDEEAKSDEEVVLELPGYFIAQASVDGDRIVKGITPGENLKNVVKNDNDL